MTSTPILGNHNINPYYYYWNHPILLIMANLICIDLLHIALFNGPKAAAQPRTCQDNERGHICHIPRVLIQSTPCRWWTDPSQKIDRLGHDLCRVSMALQIGKPLSATYRYMRMRAQKLKKKLRGSTTSVKAPV